jgi:hypothetical protein
MPLKATLQPDHIPVNKYTLLIVGLPPITFTEVSGIEHEIDAVDLPDRTRASGGNTQPSEFTVKVPIHHAVQLAAMEIWFQENQDPITPTAKKIATLIMTSGTGFISKSWSMTGLWPSKRKLPDLAMENEGEMAVAEYTMNADTVLPI